MTAVNALVDIRLIQRLNNWPAEESEVTKYFIKDYQKADSVRTAYLIQLPQANGTAGPSRKFNEIFSTG